MDPLPTLSLIATPPSAAPLGVPPSVPTVAPAASSSLLVDSEPASSKQAELADAPFTVETVPDSRSDARASTDSEPVPSAATDPGGREGAKPRRSIRYWAIGGIAASFSVLAIGVMLFGPSSKRVRTPQPKAAGQASSGKELLPVAGPSLGKSAQDRTPVFVPLPHQSAPKILQARTPNPASAGGKFHVAIQASDRSWVVACADNKPLFAKMFTNGSRQDIEFIARAIVRVGSSSAVQIAVNGKPVGIPGGVGPVRIVELTPGESHFLDDGTPNDCTRGQ